jgi:hypothetical protein
VLYCTVLYRTVELTFFLYYELFESFCNATVHKNLNDWLVVGGMGWDGMGWDGMGKEGSIRLMRC